MNSSEANSVVVHQYGYRLMLMQYLVCLMLSKKRADLSTERKVNIANATGLTSEQMKI
jgi:hypothetical protein